MGNYCFKSKTHTETRLERAIQKKRAEHNFLVKEMQKNNNNKSNGVHGKPHALLTFESILMKFRKVQHATTLIKTAFNNNTQADGTLNIDGLVKAMKVLHGSMTIDEIKHVFDFVDLDASKSISMKEFIVALAVGHCLDLVPEVITDSTLRRTGNQVAPANINNNNNTGTKEVNVVTAENKKNAAEIAEMLDLIVSAWILFDTDGKGYIEKAAISKVLGDAGANNYKQTHNNNHNTVPNTNSSLGDEKMKEMDIDNGGTVDFAEFVFSFASWVDIDGELKEGSS